MTLAMVGIANVIFAFMTWYLSRQNDRRRRGDEDAKVANMSEDEIADLGDRSPRFVYTV